ncbi:MAG: LamG-like jellyroll fold domain-containing protein, partial [Verrucomicrobiota bacterium]
QPAAAAPGEMLNRLPGGPHGAFTALPRSSPTNGIIGPAQAFGPDTSELDLGSIDPGSALTVECWFAPRSVPNLGRIFSSGDAWFLGMTNWWIGGPFYIRPFAGAEPVTLGFNIPGEWHHVVLREPASGPLEFYLDGELFFDFGENDMNHLNRFTLSHPMFPCDAVIDEVRVSRASRSADWIRATWQTTMDHDAFQCYQPVTTNLPIDIDTDNDGFSDADEVIANTDPFDPGSFLWIRIQAGLDTLVRTLTFPSSTGRIYGIERSTNLFDDTWSPVRTNARMPSSR